MKLHSEVKLGICVSLITRIVIFSTLCWSVWFLGADSTFTSKRALVCSCVSQHTWKAVKEGSLSCTSTWRPGQQLYLFCSLFSLMHVFLPDSVCLRRLQLCKQMKTTVKGLTRTIDFFPIKYITFYVKSLFRSFAQIAHSYNRERTCVVTLSGP